MLVYTETYNISWINFFFKYFKFNEENAIWFAKSDASLDVITMPGKSLCLVSGKAAQHELVIFSGFG